MSTPDLKVVPIADGRPPLTDIAAWLRRLADNLEADGLVNNILTVLVVTLDTGGTVHTACFGDNPSRQEVVGILSTAAAIRAVQPAP